MNWRLDPLIVGIVAAATLAIIFPASGTTVEVFSWATKIAISFLFFPYGARLNPQDALTSVKHWRLHITILVLTFVLFPILGLLMKPLDWILSPGLYLGILYLTLVPSTVQSSVNFTSIAKGSIAGVIVSASASNPLGVVVILVLVMLLMAIGGDAHVDSSVFLDISLQSLLPLVISQLTRRWTLELAVAKTIKNVDRLSIAMIVYVVFSEGMVQGIWSKVPAGNIVVLILLSIVPVEFVLRLSGFIANKMGLDRKDRITIQLCGSKRSLATGLPTATVIFGANASLYILLLMIFHQVQLMICAVYAARWGKEAEAEPERQSA